MSVKRLLQLFVFSAITLINCFQINIDSSTVNAATLAGDYVFRKSWGEGGLKFDIPTDAAVGPDGRIYVLNSGAGRVLVITPGERIFNSWGGYGENPGDFLSPDSIAIDLNGNIYIADGANYRIQKFSADGVYLTGWGTEGDGPGEFDASIYMAVDSDGFVYVSDEYHHRIQKFSSNGTFIRQWGGPGSGEGEFDYPVGIAVSDLGIIFVADSGNNRIQKFNSMGAYLGEWAVSNSPKDVVIDSMRNVYVAELYPDNVLEKFTSDGQLLQTWALLYYPFGLGISNKDQILIVDISQSKVVMFDSDGNDIIEWVNDPHTFRIREGIAVGESHYAYIAEDNRIIKTTADGAYLMDWDLSSLDRGGMIALTDVEITTSGNVFVCNAFKNRVQVFSPNGEFLFEWGNEGSAPGQFSSPFGLAIDEGNGVIYVADSGNDRVQKFTLQGSFIQMWGASGSTDGLFNWPDDVVVDDSGYVYVADYNNGRVQKFSSSGTFIDQWGNNGEGGETDLSVSGAAIDAMSVFHLLDYGGSIIMDFSLNGEYLSKWGSRGNAVGEFYGLSDIEIVDDVIYLADRINNRIQEFTRGLPEVDPSTGLILNGDFEASFPLSEWTYGGALPVERDGFHMSGNYSLQLGDQVDQTNQGQGDAWAHTTFYVRPEWDRPVLSFKYNMFVNDIMDYSDFFVAIQDGVGLNHLATVLRDGYQPCIPGAAPAPATDLGWRTATYDLSAYKGQHIRLAFSNRNLWDTSWGIWTYVDDVRVIDAGPLSSLGANPIFLPTINHLQCDAVPGWREGVGFDIRPDLPW